MSGVDFVSILLWLVAASLFPLAIFAMYRKNRRSRRALMKDEFTNEPASPEEIIEDPEALRRAEDAVHKGTPLQVREDLLVTHSLAERFQTMRGFSEEYMNDLVAELAKENISAIFLFQETLPLGYASISRAQGVYELYVGHGDEARAQELIQAKLRES